VSSWAYANCNKVKRQQLTRNATLIYQQRQGNSTVRDDSDCNRKLKYNKNSQSIGSDGNITRLESSDAKRQQLTDGNRIRINRQQWRTLT